MEKYNYYIICETTGLPKKDLQDPNNPYILRILLDIERADRDRKVVRELDFYVKCPISIPEQIIAYNGISEMDLDMYGEDYVKVMVKIKDFFKTYPPNALIGHNLKFINDVIESNDFRYKVDSGLLKLKQIDIGKIYNEVKYTNNSKIYNFKLVNIFSDLYKENNEKLNGSKGKVTMIKKCYKELEIMKLNSPKLLL